MTLNNIIFGTLAIVALISIIFLGLFSYILWKIGEYKKAVMCAVFISLLFLFFFGQAIDIRPCFGLC